MAQLELGQVVELELASCEARVPAWTIQAIESHVWFEPHVAVRAVTGERIRVVGAGRDGAAWCLDSRVVEVLASAEHPIPLLKVEDHGRWRTVQRREYFRVPVTLRVTLALTRTRIPERLVGELVAVTTVDLSGAGLQLETAHALMVGDALALAVELPARKLDVAGHVTRVTDRYANSLFRRPGRDVVQLVGVELGPMMERDRAELVRFVHDVERKRKPKPTSI